MIRKIFNLLIRAFFAGALLIGLLLVWVSIQSFESAASLLDHLAADGELEAFNISLYQTLRFPFALAGICITILVGFTLFRWKKTESWIQGSPAQARHFIGLLYRDTQNFIADAKVALLGRGWLDIAILFGITLAAVIVRLRNINLPFGHDEAYMYNAFASRSLWHMMSNYHLPNNHILLSIIIKITTQLLGDHVWTIRLPSIVAGVLMVPAAYWFAKGQYSRETAVLSSLLVAVFPVLVNYSVLARGYSAIGLITLLLFTLGFYVREKENRFAWLLIVVLSTLGFYTIPIMLFPFGAFYIWLLASFFIEGTRSYESRSSFLKYWVGSGISAAILTVILYAPIIIYNYGRFFGNGVIAPLEWDIFPITMWVRVRNTWLEWTTSIPLWISLLGVIGMCVSLVFHKKFSRQKFPVQLAFLIWIATLLILRRPDMLPRFWLFLAAPLVVWSAAGVIEPLRKIPVTVGKGWKPAQLAISFVLALVVVQSLLLIPAVLNHWNDKDGVENVTIYLKDQIQQDDLATASTAHLPALRYYFAIYEIPKGAIRQSGEFQRAFIIVDNKKNETLNSVAPKLAFDIPAINLDTAQAVFRFEEYTIYETEPAP